MAYKTGGVIISYNHMAAEDVIQKSKRMRKPVHAISIDSIQTIPHNVPLYIDNLLNCLHISHKNIMAVSMTGLINKGEKYE